jgi:uncharacterized membrane protein (UPF0127 family)
MKGTMLLLLSIFFSLLLLHNSWGYGIDSVSFVNGESIGIEIASTPSELQRGLMYREYLPEGAGMFFIFESEERHGFWMKNMNFPLDIIWIDSDLNIVDITGEVAPCHSDPCAVYSPSVPARYVLEVPAGYAQEKGIFIGQEVALTKLESVQ